MIGRQAVPVFNYALAFALQLTKARKTSVRAAVRPQDYSLRRLGCLLRDSFGWPGGRQLTSVTRVTSVSPLSAQMPSELQD
jgi:hypothetical protein